MTYLSEVAASVAKALDLVDAGDCWDVRLPQRIILRRDGRNLTDPYWFKRCIEWLLKRGIYVQFAPDQQHCWIGEDGHDYLPGDTAEAQRCPAAEFPARAIHELMRIEP